MRRLLLFLFVTTLLVGCATSTAERVIPLPTLIPSPTPSIDMEAAWRTAELFLDAWTRDDFDLMHQLISTPTQEATTLAEFRARYTDVQNLMTLDKLTYAPRGALRTGDRVLMFAYDVTFETDLLGTFSDKDRELTLVIDPFVGEWRVAWSPGDILPEMGRGAELRFESNTPTRANIYDRNGQVLANQQGAIVEVWVIENDIPEETACIAGLAETTGKSAQDIQNLFQRSGDNWIINVGTMEPLTFYENQARLERDCEATFRNRAIRQYPRGSLMPHILGHVGYPDPDEVEAMVRAGFTQETIIGKSGIEATWDETLRGKPGGRLMLVGANGERLRVLSEITAQIPESLWLTIDADLQEYVLRTIGEAYSENQAGWAQTSQGGAAVVMDVRNGEVLALVSWPSFEGNALNPFPAVGRDVADSELERLADDPATAMLNRTTQGGYPAGSTMKVVDAIAVNNEGIYSPDQAYYCNGRWQNENDVRFDWNSGHGSVTIETALMQSCNPFFYEMGFNLHQADPFLLPDYARRLGLGVPTGLDDLPESSGQIIDPEWVRVNRAVRWSYSDAVNMAIGQGEMEVTPLQMTRMYAAIANGGTLYQPQIVRERGILDQRTFEAAPQITSQFDVRDDVLQTVQDGLCRVPTERLGTASHIFRLSPLLNIGVCGKTGTAQSSGTKPSHAWFIAWGPRDIPEIAVTVIIENSGEGSAVAAPLVKRIMEYYFFGPFD